MGLGDRRGQVVAHRALTQAQPGGDLSGLRTRGRRQQNLLLPLGERIGAEQHRLLGELGVDDPQARVNLADRLSQRLGRGVLDDEARCSRLHAP